MTWSLYRRPNGVLAVLGTIRHRPWGDEKHAEEILRVTTEVIGGAK